MLYFTNLNNILYKIDYCTSNKCTNGECVSTSYSYNCQCDFGYSDKYCDRFDALSYFKKLFETHSKLFYGVVIVLAFVLSSAILIFCIRHCKSNKINTIKKTNESTVRFNSQSSQITIHTINNNNRPSPSCPPQEISSVNSLEPVLLSPKMHEEINKPIEFELPSYRDCINKINV